jgi:hypothetical protein
MTRSNNLSRAASSGPPLLATPAAFRLLRGMPHETDEELLELAVGASAMSAAAIARLEQSVELLDLRAGVTALRAGMSGLIRSRMGRLAAANMLAESCLRTERALIPSEDRFGSIFAGPPWQYTSSASNGAAANHFRTPSTEAITALPVRALALPNAQLHRWVPTPLLSDAFHMLCCFRGSFQCPMKPGIRMRAKMLVGRTRDFFRSWRAVFGPWLLPI